MGLLSRMAGAARRGGPELGEFSGITLGNAAIGGALGAGYGGANYDNPGAGALGGAALGAGAGAGLVIAGGSRQLMHALVQGWEEGGLEGLKREAMGWVRDPRVQARITAAGTPEEVQQIVEEVVSRTTVRRPGGSY